MISRNLAQRIAVAVIFGPLILFLVFRGGDYFLYFILLLGAIGAYEYLSRGGIRLYSPFFIVPFAGIIAAIWLSSVDHSVIGMLPLLGVFLLVGIMLAVGKDPVETLFHKLIYITWGTLYLGLLYPYVYHIRGEAAWMEPSPGQWWLLLLFASLWLGDTAAMFFGKSFGRHKLAPTVSPNKTVEGFLGGLIGYLVAAMIVKIFWLTNVPAYHFIIIALLLGLFGQLGDLVESLWKRSLGIKDSSHIIPGHGGVLDRFDSLLFSAPVLYLYLRYVAGIISW
jgi:phosphatidate cytidylyltransferase